MSTYTEHEQRQLDQASGDDLDKRTARGKPAYSDYLDRPIRSKEAVALDLAVDALAVARTKLLGFKRLAPKWTSIDQVIEKVDRALYGIAELRK